jgi:hypothetical protein
MVNRLRSLCLTVAAICAVGAVAVDAAQAAPHWRVEAINPFTGEEKLAETVTLTPRVAGESPASLEMTIPGFGITYNATGLSVQGGLIQKSNQFSASSFTITGITITKATGCRVRSVGGTFGTVKSKAVNGELKTIGSATYLALSPAGTDFGEVEVAKVEGKSCAFSGTSVYRGTILIQVQTETVNTAEELTSDNTNPTEFFYLNKPIYIDATVDSSLVSGKKWGVALTP